MPVPLEGMEEAGLAFFCVDVWDMPRIGAWLIVLCEWIDCEYAGEAIIICGLWLVMMPDCGSPAAVV